MHRTYSVRSGLGSKCCTMAVHSPRLLLSLGVRDKVNMKARTLITTLLSTTAVVAAQSPSAAGWAAKNVQNHNHVRQPSPTAACCYPATYSSLASHWTRQSCLASDLLELHHTAKYTGRPAPAPSRPLTSGSDEEDECLQWYDIDTHEFVQLVEGEKLQLFDVREPEELEETGIIPGAVNLPLGEVEDALGLSPDQFEGKYGAKKPSKDDANIVFHCRAGVRSLSALQSAHQMGYSRAKHYVRGWLGWEEHLQQG